MTLANRMVVKRTITYREVTVAIGILVAVVIAFTLWVKAPAEKITKSGFRSHMSLPTIGVQITIKDHFQNLPSKILPQSR